MPDQAEPSKPWGLACVDSMRGVAYPEEFMSEIRQAMAWLGRVERVQPGIRSLLLHLRRASDAAGGFEEYD